MTGRVPHEARPLLRRARDASQRLVHDEIDIWEEGALFYQMITFMCIISRCYVAHTYVVFVE